MKTMTNIEIGTFLAVYIRYDGGVHHVMASHWDEIDAALHQQVERNIDRVLTLTNCNGAEIMLPASQIGAATRSTPESRERQRERDAAFKVEGGFEE